MVTPIVLCTSKILSVKLDMGLCEVLMKLTTIAKVSKPSSDILSIRFKHTCILRIFGLFKKYFKILYTKANFQAFVFL
jgi:hypothetical protein